MFSVEELDLIIDCLDEFRYSSDDEEKHKLTDSIIAKILMIGENEDV